MTARWCHKTALELTKQKDGKQIKPFIKLLSKENPTNTQTDNVCLKVWNAEKV